MDQQIKALLKRVHDNFSPSVASGREQEQEDILKDIYMLIGDDDPIYDDSKPIPFMTAGELKKGLLNVPDDRIIMAQVVGTDNSAWNMRAELYRKVKYGTVGVITLSHKDLTSLPRDIFQSTKENA